MTFCLLSLYYCIFLINFVFNHLFWWYFVHFKLKNISKLSISMTQFRGSNLLFDQTGPPILRAPFHYCVKICSQNLPIYIRRSSEALALKVCEEYCSNYYHLPSAHKGDSEAVLVSGHGNQPWEDQTRSSCEPGTVDGDGGGQIEGSDHREAGGNDDDVDKNHFA